MHFVSDRVLIMYRELKTGARTLRRHQTHCRFGGRGAGLGAARESTAPLLEWEIDYLRIFRMIVAYVCVVYDVLFAFLCVCKRGYRASNRRAASGSHSRILVNKKIKKKIPTFFIVDSLRESLA